MPFGIGSTGADKVPPAMRNFLDEWATQGGKVAKDNDLPVSAMLACASIESFWGTGFIFRNSLNPFSLQKWPHIPFPRAYKIFWNDTVVQTNPKKVLKAPFTCATDRADAVRQWCEWILHYGAIDGPPGNPNSKAAPVASAPGMANRDRLLKLRRDPLEFAKNLPLVGFGEGMASGKKYADRLSDFSMTDYD